MVRNITLAILLLVVFSFQGLCEEPKTEPATAPKLTARCYRLPPGFITSADPKDKNGKRKPNPGFSYMQGSEKDVDAIQFLRQDGVQFPTGSMAIYDGSNLIVVNTPENLDLVEGIVCGDPGGPDIMVHAEFSALECSLPSNGDAPSFAQLSYSDLTQLAGKSIKQVDGVSVLSKFGQRCTSEHVVKLPKGKSTGSSAPNSEFASKFAEDELGTKVELEPTIGPDNVTMNLNTVYRLRYKTGDQVGYIEFLTKLSAWDGYPLVLHVSPLPDQNGKFVVIVLRARVVNCGGWKWTRAHAEAKE